MKHKTPYFLEDVKTGEVHYFDYAIDKREAQQAMDENGQYRFKAVAGGNNKFVNPKGEQVFPRQDPKPEPPEIEEDEEVDLDEEPEEEQEVKRGRPKKSEEDKDK